VSGGTEVTGESRRIRATSFSLAWRTSVALRAMPDSVASSVRPSVTVVGYGVLPETRSRWASWKQWPVVRTHSGAMSAPVQ
jgi:hypothetical protein